jgi:hypothetical protein
MNQTVNSFECVAHGKELHFCPECSPENFCECCDPPVVRKLCPKREAIDSLRGGKCDGDGSCLKQCSCTCYYYYVNPIDGTVRDEEDLEGIDLEKAIKDGRWEERVREECICGHRGHFGYCANDSTYYDDSPIPELSPKAKHSKRKAKWTYSEYPCCKPLKARCFNECGEKAPRYILDTFHGLCGPGCDMRIGDFRRGEIHNSSEQELLECPVCYETKRLLSFKDCGHMLCFECINRMVYWGNTGFTEKKPCPMCRR